MHCTMTATTQLRYRLHPQAAHRKVAGEVFVVTGDRAFHRMQTATAIALFDALGQAEAGATAAELVAALRQQFDVNKVMAENDVADFIETLVTRQLAVPVHPPRTAADCPSPADPQAEVTP